MKKFLPTLIRIIFILMAIQVMRAFVAFLFGFFAFWLSNTLILQSLNSLVYVFVGGGLLIWRQPSMELLGLNTQGMTRREKIFYSGGAFVVIGLIIASLVIDAQANLGNLHYAVVIPLFEELIFRGWVWSKFSKALDGKWAGVATWLAVTILFGVWHLGYFDVLLRNPMPLHGITVQVLMLSKVLVGLILGAIAGVVRWRTGRVYGAILIHAAWNLFA